MKKIAALLVFLTVSISGNATDLKLSQPMYFIDNGVHYALFNVSWDNAWNNDRNHDAAWVFFKSLVPDGGYYHVSLLSGGTKVVASYTKADLRVEVPDDRVGLFIYPGSEYRGRIEATIKVMIDSDSFEGLNVRYATFSAYGIEMVNIPEGGFNLGQPGPESMSHGAFYTPDNNGNFGGLVSIHSETQTLEVSASGDLYYQARGGYEGDQTGTIPAAFPKGVRSFYIMKYEPTEGQYAAFLNSLREGQQSYRSIINEQGYIERGGSIVEDTNGFSSPYPQKPIRFMGWADAMAYADWAGLRPMTEFEFTKASRGPGTPVAGEFPWGTANKEKMQRYQDKEFNMIMRNGWDESMLSDKTKEEFGASYYWVMDMAGSVWERVVSIGHPNGRSFTGIHGDGRLSESGDADVEFWPVGDEDSGGVGFRGGGFYGYDREYHDYNPFSPVAIRPYGGWHGTARTNAYGSRFVRTSN